ncbi:hypothetical protein MRX96_003634 [Rhipicephalus microplus]
MLGKQALSSSLARRGAAARRLCKELECPPPQAGSTSFPPLPTTEAPPQRNTLRAYPPLPAKVKEKSTKMQETAPRPVSSQRHTEDWQHGLPHPCQWQGLLPDIALRFFNAVASARVFPLPSRSSRYDPRNGMRWTPSTMASYAACMACRARRRSAPPWRSLARRPSHFGREAMHCATYTACTSCPRDDAWLDDSLIVPTRAWVSTLWSTLRSCLTRLTAA